MRTAREYVMVSPLIAWLTMPLEPSDDEQPDEHAHAFEGVGVASGQIRIGQDQREQPEQRRHQPARRLRGFRMDPRDLHALLRGCIEQGARELSDEADDETDDGDSEEIGYRPDDREPDRRKLGDQELIERFAPRSSVGKSLEHEESARNRRARAQHDGGNRDEATKGIRSSRRAKKLKIAYCQLLKAPLCTFWKPRSKHAAASPDRPEERPEHHRHDERLRRARGKASPACAARPPHRWPSEVVRRRRPPFDRVFHLQLVDVPGHDDEHILATDSHDHHTFDALRDHAAGIAGGDDLVKQHRAAAARSPGLRARRLARNSMMGRLP